MLMPEFRAMMQAFTEKNPLVAGVFKDPDVFARVEGVRFLLVALRPLRRVLGRR